MPPPGVLSDTTPDGERSAVSLFTRYYATPGGMSGYLVFSTDIKMKKLIILLARFVVVAAPLAGILASGCASSSKNISKAYVSPKTYKTYTCDELAEEGAVITSRIEALAQSLDSEANKDIAQTTGAFLLAPFTYGLSLGILGSLEGGDGPEAVEYARLKGEYDAAYEMAKQKKCRL